MRHMFWVVLVCSLLMGYSPETLQASRLNDLADRADRLARDLAEHSYDTLSRSSRASRSEVEAVSQAAQLNGAAGLFSRMVRDRRPEAELRDVVSILQDLARG